jgi:neutral ceramidase
VNADLGQLFLGIKQKVVETLKAKYGDMYTDANVTIAATHQHSGPGGYSTYTLYNLTTFGFNRRNFNTIIDGIVAAIDQAHQSMQPGQIRIASGELTGISFNRSPQAYMSNPENERQLYHADVDTTMTLVRFDTVDGQPIGIITWFPVHGTSMNNKNHMINGDNKGYAEYLFEKDFSSRFVAAFAQSNAGDVSPNQYGHEGGSGDEGLLAVEAAGRPQYERAKALYQAATQVVTGGVDYRHQFVDMDNFTVAPEFTDGIPRFTCPASVGISMLAGTQDGAGFGRQGVKCDNLDSVFAYLYCEHVTTPCQGVKPIAVSTGEKLPHPWTPNRLPMQVLKIGNLIIGAAPFELTTMTGRRMISAMKQQLPADVPYQIVLSALANAYSGYVATREEYQLQRYEGASTHFGPWTEAALRHVFAGLTSALMNGLAVPAGQMPDDLSGVQLSFQTDVFFDDKPLWVQFGDVHQQVKPAYHPGEKVEVVFWGGHPKNNFRIQSTFLEVQRFENGQWKTIRTDNDWDTEYHWKRNGISYSLVTIIWRIPKDILPGKYRILHNGDKKSMWTYRISPYQGQSATFIVMAN